MKYRSLTLLAIVVLLWLASATARSQPATLSGVVNIYTPVLRFDSCTRVVVESSLGFAAGDMVLIIQMRGATVDTLSTDEKTFGRIVDYGTAGNYELATIASVTGNTIALRTVPLHAYDPAGAVQMVRVAHYGSAMIAERVTAPAWNGRTGGVIVIDVIDTLTLRANIDATGTGFGGGIASNGLFPTFTGLSATAASGVGGMKGEGIAARSAARAAARGAYANGGGGGNAHNGGGGGGGNGGAGGIGGMQYDGYGRVPLGGIGGNGLAYDEKVEKIFMGGGGGSGHENDRTGTSGRSGGGIIIVRASKIIGNANALVADGTSVPDTSGNDAAGGGGGGGTVLLQAGNATGLRVSARGGNGGNVNNGFVAACHGTGGGGGGGIFWTADASIMPGIRVDVGGGISGIEVNRQSPCFGTSYGSAPGDSGRTLFRLAFRQGPAPGAVKVSGIDSICPGGSTRLLASGPAIISYRWSPSNGLSCATCPDPIASPTRSTTYTVTAIDSFGCTSSARVTVTVLPLPTAEAGPDVAICEGGSTKLAAAATGAGSYRWSPAAGLDCDTCPSPIALPAATTTYRLTVIGPGGCTAVDSMTVVVNPLPKLVVPASIGLCAGSSVALTASGGASYRWWPADGLDCDTCPSPIASPAATTTYHVEAMSREGCAATDSVTVTVYPVDIAPGPSPTICRGDSAPITARGGVRYRWSPAEGLDCDSCQTLMASPSTTTTYTATVVTAQGCIDSVEVTVTVLSPPAASAGKGGALCLGDSIVLHASGGTSYAWSPAEGLSCATCSDPVARPERTTWYHVRVTGENGCQGDDSVMVIVNEPRVVHAHIDRGYHTLPGGRLSIPILLDAPLDGEGIESFELSLSCLPGMCRFDTLLSAGTLTDSWSTEVVENDRMKGIITATLTAPPGRTLAGSGTLVAIGASFFVGSSETTELPFTLKLPGAHCLELVPEPGLVALDSICGLTFRLIERIAGSYALDGNRPNPFNPSTVIPFSIGLDGHTTLEVLDALGNHVATLVDAAMKPGSYEVVWDASAFPSGIYYYRIRSGDWSSQGRMTLVK